MAARAVGNRVRERVGVRRVGKDGMVDVGGRNMPRSMKTSLHLLRLTLQHNNPLMIRCRNDKEDANNDDGRERGREEEERERGG